MIRQDYLLRLITELREFVATVLGSGDPTRAREALHAIMQAQQRLFQSPPPQFLGLTLDAQIDLLTRAEAPLHAVEKVAIYAATLTEAARVYAAMRRDDLATASRQLAREARLVAAERWPNHRTEV